MKPSIPYQRTMIITALLILSIFFFTGGPSYYSTRSFQAFWNLGHIIYYALLPLVMLPYLKKKVSRFWTQTLFIFGVTMLLGLLVELIQANFARSPDTGDLFRNMIGALICIAFFLPARNTIAKWQRRLLVSITAALILTQVAPLAIALTDEYRASNQFPMLSDFENAMEIQRWYGNADMTLARTPAHSGRSSLKVDLGTTQYSGISLRHFPENWDGYDKLQIFIYNPSPDILPITCRIHDQIHIQNKKGYWDRFNKVFRLTQGWNAIEIDLQQVKSAPADRPMDMRHIHGLGIFTTQLPQPHTIYIDDVRLLTP